MNRFALVGLSLGLLACGGTGFSSFDETTGSGGNAPDASSTGGNAGSSNGTGGSTSSTGGSAGAVGTGGAIAAGGAAGTNGASGGGGAGGAVGTGGNGGRPGTGGSAGGVVDAGPRDATPPADAGPGPECKVDTDCKLGDTCCECTALGPGDKLRPCELLCIQSACSAQQIHGVRCSRGQCVLAPECDPKNVLCKIATPVCPAGQVPSVKGTCWGECVVASACRTVADCNACASDAYLCARQEAQLGSTFRCVDVPVQCGNNLTCACAGAAACLPPFSSCNTSMSGKQFNCSCPTC